MEAVIQESQTEPKNEKCSCHHIRGQGTALSLACGEVKVIFSHAFLPGLQRAPVTTSTSTAHIFLLSLDPSGFLWLFVSDNHISFYNLLYYFELVKLLLAPRFLLNYLLPFLTIPHAQHQPKLFYLVYEHFSPSFSFENSDT